MPPCFRVVEESAWSKMLEDLRALRGRNADSTVAHRQRDWNQAAVRAGHREGKHHLTALGKLDRVVEQIDEHLPQPKRIADHAHGGRRRGLEPETDPFGGRAPDQEAYRLAAQPAHLER